MRRWTNSAPMSWTSVTEGSGTSSNSDIGRLSCHGVHPQRGGREAWADAPGVGRRLSVLRTVRCQEPRHRHAVFVAPDSGYLADAGGPEHRPYLTLWCPLVDVGPHNGSISVLPYERVGGALLRRHWRDPQTNDRIRYDGDDPGAEMTAAAGDVAAFLKPHVGQFTRQPLRRD